MKIADAAGFLDVDEHDSVGVYSKVLVHFRPAPPPPPCVHPSADCPPAAAATVPAGRAKQETAMTCVVDVH